MERYRRETVSADPKAITEMGSTNANAPAIVSSSSALAVACCVENGTTGIGLTVSEVASFHRQPLLLFAHQSLSHSRVELAQHVAGAGVDHRKGCLHLRARKTIVALLPKLECEGNYPLGSAFASCLGLAV